MRVATALTLMLALASSSTVAIAQSTDGAVDGKVFTYRYKKIVFVNAGQNNPPTGPTDPDLADTSDPPETVETCGNFTITDGFGASSQSLDANGDCVFNAPVAAAKMIGFDYTTAEAFCANTMNGGGRIAKIAKSGGAGIRSISGSVNSIVTSQFQMPGISAITCSIAPTPCDNGEFQDGGSCLPKTDLSCGRLKNDQYHVLPAGDEVEMASIGECTFQIPQVTVGGDLVSIMGEGQTMRKWVSTLPEYGYAFDGFISDYSLSSAPSVDYAYWRSSANVPTIPIISYPMVDYITIADTGYGSPATLPADLVATAYPSDGDPMEPVTTVTIRFTPEASAAGESQISELALYDENGNPINITETRINVETGPTITTSLTDGNVNSTHSFVNTATPSRPDSIAVYFSAAARVGAVAIRAASSADKFPLSVRVYADKNSNTPLFYAGTRQYDKSEKVQGGGWAHILNPAYN